MNWIVYVAVAVKLGVSLAAPLSESQTAASLSGELHETTGGGAVSDVRYIDLMTAAELAGSRPELSKLADIYSMTEMKFKLEQSRHVTVLMPSNRALDKAARQGIDLEHTSYQISLPILQFFIIPEVIEVSKLTPGTHVFESVEGSKLTLVKPENPNRPVKVNGETIGFQIDNANGVAYVLDGMIYPDSMDVQDIRQQKMTHRHPAHSPDIPEHVQQTNIAHSRYDRTPVNQPAEVDQVEKIAEDTQGVLGDDDADTTDTSYVAEDVSQDGNVIAGGGVLPDAEEPLERSSNGRRSQSEGLTSFSRTSVRRRRHSSGGL